MPLECHWLTLCTMRYHWTTQRILAGYTGTPLGKFSWNCPTLECHWRNSDYCNLHWNTTGGTITAHTHPGTLLGRVASIPIWNDKMTGHQATSLQVSVNSAFTWSFLLPNAYQFCFSSVWVFQHNSVHTLDMRAIIVFFYNFIGVCQ